MFLRKKKHKTIFYYQKSFPIFFFCSREQKIVLQNNFQVDYLFSILKNKK